MARLKKDFSNKEKLLKQSRNIAIVSGLLIVVWVIIKIKQKKKEA